MIKKSLVKSVFAVSLASVFAMSLMGCSSTSDTASDVKYTGGVAATVNGVEIAEDDVTEMIQSQRESYSLDDDDSWGNYLVTYGMTPEQIRENFIDGFVSQEIVKQYANELGVTVEDSEIEELVESMKSNYSSDEAWQEALTKVGMTEDEYREDVELSLVVEDVEAYFTPDEPSDETLLTYAQQYASSYSGAKKSSHILFNSDDEATAQSVLDQINAGTLDFATAAQEYSQDTGSATDGGNVGWDKLTTFVDEYQDALDQLEVGQVSGLVTSQYGIHIIKCTDEWTAPEELTDPNQLPEEMLEQVRSKALSADADTALDNWIEEKRAGADIVINDMPADVPYNIDLTAYQSDDSTDESAGESTDGSAEGDATASEGTDSADGADAEAISDGTADAGTDAAEGDSSSSEGQTSASDAGSSQPSES